MKYLRSRDMCEMFQISLGTLYNWRLQGMPFIGSEGAGLSFFYDEEKVLKWISNRKVKEKEEVKDTIKKLYEDWYGLDKSRR